MNTHGNTIKNLRKERKITQQQLIEGISSRASLSSFENDKSLLSLDIFFILLDRMNIQPEEYWCLFKDSTTEKKRISDFMYSDLIHKPLKEIKDFLNYLNKRYKESNDFFFYCIYIQIKLNLFKNGIEGYRDINFNDEKATLKSYLKNIDTWGHFEITLITNCLFLFELDVISTFYDMYKYHDTLKHLPGYKSDISAFIINYIVLCFERENYDDISTLLKDLFDNTTVTSNLYERALHSYFTELLIIIKNSKKTEKLDQIIDIFNLINAPDIVSDLKKFKLNILKKHDYTEFI